MASIFSRIVSGELPCYKVAEDDRFLAFLDLSPLRLGHTLVIPKIEVDYIFDLEDYVLGDLMIFSKQVAKKIHKIIPCEKVGLTVIGLEVRHAHIHLVPIYEISDMDFSKKKLHVSSERLMDLAMSIRNVQI
jgi:histidine triad (HIT) family protein